MIKAIFFDMEGVLLQGNINQAAMEYEKEFDIPGGEGYKIIHDHQGWKDFSLGKISEREYLDQCQRNSNGYIFDAEKFVEILDKTLIPNRELVDYAKELSSHYIIGVISNNPKEWFERLIKKAGLDQTIIVKAISCYLHIRKPTKEIFSAALSQAGVRGEEAVYIDDRRDRVEGAKALGMKVIIYDGDLAKIKQEIENIE